MLERPSLAASPTFAHSQVSRALNEPRRALEENPRYTLEDLWGRYRGTLVRLLKWDWQAFNQIRDFAQQSRSKRPIAARTVSTRRRAPLSKMIFSGSFSE
ncbi:hypothetical protein B0G77_8478 [Paraburkholderia sp. BL10I2N1]|nr:hypothetical protein B0G77_8478 [Paraburkholderia sp. BL10I2N1]